MKLNLLLKRTVLIITAQAIATSSFSFAQSASRDNNPQQATVTKGQQTPCMPALAQAEINMALDGLKACSANEISVLQQKVTSFQNEVTDLQRQIKIRQDEVARLTAQHGVNLPKYVALKVGGFTSTLLVSGTAMFAWVAATLKAETVRDTWKMKYYDDQLLDQVKKEYYYTKWGEAADRWYDIRGRGLFAALSVIATMIAVSGYAENNLKKDFKIAVEDIEKLKESIDQLEDELKVKQLAIETALMMAK